MRKLTLLKIISFAKRLKCAFKSQYRNGFQKLLLIAVHVTKNSKNGGSCTSRPCTHINNVFSWQKQLCVTHTDSVSMYGIGIIQKMTEFSVRQIWFIWSTPITFDPVHVATISWIVHGVTSTINPKDMAAIVRDTDPLIRRSDPIVL